MATKYTFNFTDTSKVSFDLFPYTANGPVSPSDGTLIDQAVAQTTTLKLYGKGMKDYGEGIAQDLIYILENFANSIAPINAIEGQIWYKNAIAGSPPIGPELVINSSKNTIPSWDAVILATGISPMTGELILSADPVNLLGAVTKQYVDAYGHITSEQQDFLNELDLPTLKGGEVSTLIDITLGITVQSQLDNKISKTGDTMAIGASLTFQGGGEVFGLPVSPSSSTAATSRQYVDNKFGSISGDGVLTAVNWITDQGSAVTITDTTLEFIVSGGSTFIMDGISRVGHTQPATDITLSGPTGYGADVQTGLNYIEGNKADLNGPSFTGNTSISGTLTVLAPTSFTGTTTALEPTTSNQIATKNYVDNNGGGGVNNISRKLDLITTDITGTPYSVLSHTIDDNKMAVTINGLKQYNSTHGFQEIQYDSNTILISNTTPTGLDPTITYEFNIDIDGISNTITIPSGTSVSTHSSLISYINSQFLSGSPPIQAKLSISDTSTERFTALTYGSTSSIAISNPSSSSTYLFATDATETKAIAPIQSVNFIYDISGSPIKADELVIIGDVTGLDLFIGRTFTIRGSIDTNYGSYDGVYSVHNSGAFFDGGAPGTTTIPVAVITDPSTAQALFPSYTGSPLVVPAPVPFGSVHFTPLAGFDQNLTGINGVTGDYFETDVSGSVLPLGSITDYVVFNSTILAGGSGSPPTTTLIETIMLQ